MHMTCLDWDLHGRVVYEETMVHAQRPMHWGDARCACGWVSFAGTAAARDRRMKARYRDHVLEGLAGIEVVCKRPAKRKSGTAGTYTAESKKKQRLRWAKASQQQAERRKDETKARKRSVAAAAVPNPV